MEFILSPRLLQPAALAGWRALLSHQYLSWVSDSGSSKNESSAPPKNGDQYSNLWFDTSLPKGRQNRDKQHESINVRKRQQPGQKNVDSAAADPGNWDLTYLSLFNGSLTRNWIELSQFIFFPLFYTMTGTKLNKLSLFRFCYWVTRHWKNRETRETMFSFEISLPNSFRFDNFFDSIKSSNFQSF